MSRQLELALLCHRQKQIASTVLDHLDSLVRHSRHNIHEIPMLGALPPGLDLERFDAIIVHYSLTLENEQYCSAETLRKLAAASATKIVFIQDEYRHVNATQAALRGIDARLLLTCVPPSEIEKVYPAIQLPNLKKVNVLTGYVNPALNERQIPAFEDRDVDVGYRARRLPAWLGDLGREKWMIGQRFAADAEAFGLRCDIRYREEERLYGEDWIEFLTRCRATLGVESGASVVDFDGSVQAGVDRDLKEIPDIPYDVLRARHFEQLEGKIKFNQISPRCFEAASLRTLMILYEGDYSGILKAERHYVPLRKDHANMPDVVGILRDPMKSQQIIAAAHDEIACSDKWTFETFVKKFDDAAEKSVTENERVVVRPYSAAEIAEVLRDDWHSRRRRLTSAALLVGYRLLYRHILGFLNERSRDQVARILNPIIVRALRSILYARQRFQAAFAGRR